MSLFKNFIAKPIFSHLLHKFVPGLDTENLEKIVLTDALGPQAEVIKFEKISNFACKIQIASRESFIFFIGSLDDRVDGLLLGSGHLEMLDILNDKKFESFINKRRVKFKLLRPHQSQPSPISHFKLVLSGYYLDKNDGNKIFKMFHLYDNLGRMVLKNFNFYFNNYFDRSFVKLAIGNPRFSILCSVYFFALIDNEDRTACFLKPPTHVASLKRQALDRNNQVIPDPLEFILFEQRFLWDDFWLLEDSSVLRNHVHAVDNKDFRWYPVLAGDENLGVEITAYNKWIECQNLRWRMMEKNSSHPTELREFMHAYDNDTRQWEIIEGQRAAVEDDDDIPPPPRRLRSQ